MKDEYRMPDGTWVTSANKMSKAWAKIYEPICKEFGVDIRGYDPDISFRRDIGRGFEIPTDIAIQICKIIKERDELRRFKNDLIPYGIKE